MVVCLSLNLVDTIDDACVSLALPLASLFLLIGRQR